MGDLFQRVSVTRVAVHGADYDAVLSLRVSGYWRWFVTADQAADHLDSRPGVTIFLARHVEGRAVGTARVRWLGDEHGTLELSLFTVMPGRQHRRAARLLLWRECLALAQQLDAARLLAILPESFERECAALGLRCISRAATLPSGQSATGACLFSATVNEVMHHLRQTDHPLSRLLFEKAMPGDEPITPARPRHQSRAA